MIHKISLNEIIGLHNEKILIFRAMFVDLKRGKGFSTGAKADSELFLLLLKTNTLGKIKVKNILNVLIL